VAALTLTESERRFLRALLRRKVPFIVVGLSAAALQGAPVVTQDVDLWFKDLHDPRLTKALREIGAAYVPPSILNPPMFAGAGTELFDIVLRMDGLGKFSDELRHCIEVRLGAYRLKVLSLERILASKQAANRSKDKLTIPVLQDSLLAASTSKQAKREPRKIKRRT
jgi:predicted nucleotidyltransferase